MQDKETKFAAESLKHTPRVDLSVLREEITEKIKHNGRLIITNNDCAVAIMLEVNDSDLEDTMIDLASVQAIRALNKARANALTKAAKTLHPHSPKHKARTE